ncbi:MAG: hypothetical protein GIW94_11880 [Candidatus Eremiobacteraeota bacterium]|nr:hypothetical protein [Candidatus Eremiobacteraeota bacterium]
MNPRNPDVAQIRTDVQEFPLRFDARIAALMTSAPSRVNILSNGGYDGAVDVEVADERPPTIAHRGGNRTRFDAFRQQRKTGGDRAGTA